MEPSVSEQLIGC